MFADQPGLLTGKVLLALVLDPLGRSIGDPHPNGCKTGFQTALGPVSPTHILPLGVGELVFGCSREDVRNVPLAGTTPTGNRSDQLDADRVHLEVTRDTNGPGKPACREPLSKPRTEAVSRIRQHTAEAHIENLICEFSFANPSQKICQSGARVRHQRSVRQHRPRTFTAGCPEARDVQMGATLHSTSNDG